MFGTPARSGTSPVGRIAATAVIAGLLLPASAIQAAPLFLAQAATTTAPGAAPVEPDPLPAAEPLSGAAPAPAQAPPPATTPPPDELPAADGPPGTTMPGLDVTAPPRSVARPRESEAPIFEKWWFWTAIAAVAVTSVVIVATSSGPSAPRSDLGNMTAF